MSEKQKNTPDPSAPSDPAAPEGAAGLYEALRKALEAAAKDMGLALGMEGETFTPPMETHLRGKIALESSAPATLGPGALIRHDGKLEITVAVKAGLGVSAAMAAAQSVLERLPRGMSPALPGGEVTLRQGTITPDAAQSDRARVAVTVPFYAFTV